MSLDSYEGEGHCRRGLSWHVSSQSEFSPCSPSFAAAEVDHRKRINVYSADVFFSVEDGF